MRVYNGWKMFAGFKCFTLFNIYQGEGLWGFIVLNFGFEFGSLVKA